MYDEIEIREIIFEAQQRIDRSFVGLKVVVVEDETVATEKDVAKALQDRQKAGLSAHDNVEYATYKAYDQTTHSRPNWLHSSSRDDSAAPVLSETVELSQTVKKSYFSRLYELVSAKVKSYFNKPEKKQAATPLVSKHRNRVPCRVFKDGIAL
jgi:hypothetical protein